MQREIETYGGLLFVIDNNTGCWGITSKSNREGLKKHLQTKDRPPKKYEGVSLIVLNSSNTCNLDCLYCSEINHRGLVNNMSPEIAKSIIDKVLETNHPPQIVFHGSEPSLNWDWIKRIIQYGERRGGEVGKRLSFSMQSNLAELPNDFFDFIEKHKIGVSTSIDGTKDIHDKTRPYTNGGGSYDDIMGNARKLLTRQGELNVITVVNKYNVDRLNEIMYHFEGEGFTDWQTLPAENIGDISPNPLNFGNAYIKLFDETLERLERGKQKIKVTALPQYLGSMFFTNGIDACRVCSSGTYHPLLAIDSDGGIYPCDFFWGEKERVIGNIDEGLASISMNQRNLRYRNIDDTECNPCSWKMNCGGGCLASAYFSKTDKTPYCVSNQLIYTHLAKKMPEFIEKGLVKKVLEWTAK